MTSFTNPDPELADEINRTRHSVTEDEFPYKGDPFEALDPDAKGLFKACQDLDHEKVTKLLETLAEETVRKVDKNGMNVFHVLLFDRLNQDWYTKHLNIESCKTVVKITKAICQKTKKSVTDAMMNAKDSINRTPLHYAVIIDGDDEDEESSVTLTFLRHGGDKALFVNGNMRKKQEAPVTFIKTSLLKSLLDTKHRNEGPIGHPDRVAHCDISILKPQIAGREEYDCLVKLAEKHTDLFDHQVVSGMIW